MSKEKNNAFTHGGEEYIKKKVMFPRNWCMYFNSDGTTTVHTGEEVETEVVFHVRKQKHDKQ